ncbi:hypothetical protein EYM_03330 [Ignicoccus islandicus DSM 13165]|uniref:ArnR1-like winged helix-turn-helix domain-containing protein n=1 Tax=Ignicoccus islandicus DSM 13165 TaxID=940295 RepID=A0A0U3FQ29_9CREN|nr:hypothetical protein EYM_03330 [Ignicoccus islandicus DSM 13165]
MKLCDKRVLALYFLLRSKFNEDVFNIGEAWEVSRNYFTKKVFMNLFKRLKKLNLIVQLSPMEYKIQDLCSILEESSFRYLSQRSKSSSS